MFRLRPDAPAERSVRGRPSRIQLSRSIKHRVEPAARGEPTQPLLKGELAAIGRAADASLRNSAK
jgi:hypothetical protein